MFTMTFPSWAWGWGWAVAILAIILLGILVLPWFFFLLNLQTTLNRVSDRNRAMPAGHVWLNFIPVFNLGWFIYTVMKVRDSVRAEYQSRGWAAEGDFGYNVGLAAGILAIVSFFLGLVPVLGWGLAIAELVCWIVYWLKTADFKNRLGDEGMWRGMPAPYGYPGPMAPPLGPGPASYQAAPPWQAAAGAETTASSPTSTTATTAAAAGAAMGAAMPAASSAASPSTAAPSAGAPPAATPLPADSAGQAPSEAGLSAEESAARQCAGCGAAFDAGDRFCRICGLPLPGGHG